MTGHRFAIICALLCLSIASTSARPTRSEDDDPCQVPEGVDVATEDCEEYGACTISGEYTLPDNTVIQATFCKEYRPLLKYACELKDANGDDVDGARRCKGGATCITDNILEIDYNATYKVNASFCSNVYDAEASAGRQYKGVLRQACLIRAGSDVRVGLSCPNNSNCVIEDSAALSVSLAGTDAEAFFCSDIIPEERSRGQGGRRRRPSSSSSSDSSSSSAGNAGNNGATGNRRSERRNNRRQRGPP